MKPGEIASLAEAALAAAPNRRTIILNDNGQRYVVKRLAAAPRSLTQTLLMRWLAKAVTGRPPPLRTLALSDAASSVQFEANRLQKLAQAGASVPRIVHRSDSYMVLEHRGPDVATLLESWHEAEWRRELMRIAADLGAWHAAGQWHGGAQIKNVTLLEGVFTRIDFEETFGEFLPLAATQATDLVVFLNSVSLAGPIHETESRHLLPLLLDAYFAANHGNEADIRDVIARALPKLALLTLLIKPLRRLSRKSIRRAEILVDVLQDFLRRQ